MLGSSAVFMTFLMTQSALPASHGAASAVRECKLVKQDLGENHFEQLFLPNRVNVFLRKDIEENFLFDVA